MTISDNAIPTPSGTPKFYLKQLDGLRFYAFLLVFIHHTKPYGAYPVFNWLIDKMHAYGWMGVDLFFVLSAFLITRLLLLEYEYKGTISIKSFLIRRCLRIWPLYFLMLLFAFFVMTRLEMRYSGSLIPNFSLSPDTSQTWEYFRHYFGYYAVFLGNFSHAFFGAPIIGLGLMWSISIEEQFYIIWPFVLRKIGKSRKKIIIFAVSGIVFSVLMRYLLYDKTSHPMIWALTITRLDPIMMGVLLALFCNKKYLKLKLVAALGLLYVVTLVPGNIGTHSIHLVWIYLAVATAFYLIVNVVVEARSKLLDFFFANGVVVYLGKISYGLYLTHQTISILTRTIVLNQIEGAKGWLIFAASSFLLTVLVSMILYHLFEKSFLRLKGRYTIVESRPA